VPYVCEKSAELLFRQKVLSFLKEEGLLSSERLAILDAWKSGNTGFSAHNRVVVDAQDKAGLERLARYLVRSPVSLERLELDGCIVHYRHKRAHPVTGEAFDAQEFLARLLMHVPAPRLHTLRYFAHYSCAARGRRDKDDTDPAQGTHSVEVEAAESKAERRRRRRQWAQLIRRIYESDPLLCECGGTLRFVSIITQESVVKQILEHLDKVGRPARGPPTLPARPQSTSLSLPS
jgi:hypothetical protein